MPEQCLTLPKDFLLDDYRIERQLSMGGFSIVYLAYDPAGEPVAIKEYLPSSMAQRTAENPVPAPGFYKPARIRGVDYVDGGVRRTANIDVAIEHGADLIICYNPFRPFSNPVSRRFRPETGTYEVHGRPLADQGMFTVLNQVFRTLLHSRLQLGIRQYQDDPHFQGDIILIEPAETDLTFFRMAPLNLWAGRRAGAHGYLSVTETVESHYELMRQILQSYGVQMTRKEVREGLERLLKPTPDASVETVLMRDVPKRDLHVA